MLSEIGRHKRTNTAWLHLLEVPSLAHCIETESGLSLLQLGAGGNAELVFRGYRIAVYKVEKFLEMEGRHLYNDVNVLNATRSYT